MSLFAAGMMVYIENPIHSTKELLNIISEFAKQPDTKSIFINQRLFLYNNNEISETEIRKKIPFDIATRKIK